MDTHQFHDLKGEQRDQLLITCDKDGNPVGTATRQVCHEGEGKTHLAFMAFIYDEKGNIWMTKRCKRKSLWALFWDASTISHVLPGETVEEASRRRGREELGIDVDFRRIGEFHYFAKFDGNCENEFCYVLVGKTSDIPHANPVEVEEVKKIRASDLYEEVIHHETVYTPWLMIAVKKVEIPSVL